MTKEGTKAKFSLFESQQKSFKDPKYCLYSTPELTLRDLQQTFKIEIGASNYAISEILIQHGHMVAYHQRNTIWYFS